jgi:glycosyltransferase involved in cell wall biosynthesis
VSICIPAFRQGVFMQRLLNSVFEQDFKNYEVVITDDSPGDEVSSVIQDWLCDPRVRYFKNQKTLGSPRNWNCALAKGRGKWIKMMHQDDWFSSDHSLSEFVINAEKTGRGSFVISQSNACDSNGIVQYTHAPPFNASELLLNPEKSLLINNYIGCPSATLFYNDKSIFFNEKLIWVVDVEAYIKIAKIMQTVLINKPLINVSLPEGDHITTLVSKNKPLMLSERCYLYEKMTCKDHISFFSHVCEQTQTMSFLDIQKTLSSPLKLSFFVKIFVIFSYLLTKLAFIKIGVKNVYTQSKLVIKIAKHEYSRLHK